MLHVLDLIKGDSDVDACLEVCLEGRDVLGCAEIFVELDNSEWLYRSTFEGDG